MFQDLDVEFEDSFNDEGKNINDKLIKVVDSMRFLPLHAEDSRLTVEGDLYYISLAVLAEKFLTAGSA